jgi:hypothetical protein
MSLSVGFCVLFNPSSTSISSSTVARGVFCGCPVLWYLLIFKNLFVRHLNSPVFQFISGLCSFNQGNLRMILYFPSPVTSKRVSILLPLMSSFNSTNEVIFPCLFFVPSTFLARRGFSNSEVLSFISLTYSWSMNCPPAPLSISPRVSTVSFSLISIVIGKEIEFDWIVATVTEKMSSTGEFDVEAALHFKNPLFQLLGRTALFRLRSSLP